MPAKLFLKKKASGFMLAMMFVALASGLASCVSPSDALEKSVQDVAARVLPAVVELDVLAVKDANDPNNLDDRPFFEYFFENPDGNKDTRPKEYRYQSLGAGVIIARKENIYYVLSNRHVIGDAREITVKLDDGREFKSDLVAQEPKKDIALVRFTSTDDLPVAKLGDSDSLRTGSFVLALGSPYGFQSTVTLGIVSALHRRGGPSDNINDFIQTDASINQGNSGGALVNLSGELIGINTWISSQTGDNVGLGFAIPINNIRAVLAGMMDGSPPRYGWLGLHMESMDQILAKDFSLKIPKGILVCGVYPGSPAEKSGFMNGDVILSFSNRDLRSYEDMVQYVSEAGAERSLKLKISRNGKIMELAAVLGPRPDDDRLAKASESLWPGAVPYPNILDADGNESSVPGKGVFIRQVVQGTLLQKAGLKTQDVVIAIDGTEIASIPGFFRLLGNSPKAGLEIKIIRQKQEITLTIPEDLR